MFFKALLYRNVNTQAQPAVEGHIHVAFLWNIGFHRVSFTGARLSVSGLPWRGGGEKHATINTLLNQHKPEPETSNDPGKFSKHDLLGCLA